MWLSAIQLSHYCPLSLFPKANVHRAFNIFAIVPRKTILIIISHDAYSMTKASKQNQKFHKTMVDKINVESVFCGSVCKVVSKSYIYIVMHGS